MQTSTFDKIAWVTIIISIEFSIYAAASWDWFPTHGQWGDIAHIPKSIKNYIALVLPAIVILMYLIIRRRYFGINQSINSANENEYQSKVEKTANDGVEFRRDKRIRVYACLTRNVRYEKK
jgi:hypothetical protein